MAGDAPRAEADSPYANPTTAVTTTPWHRPVPYPAVGAWALGAAAIAWGGTRPDAYLEHVRHVPPPHPYPSGLVLVLLALLTAETGLLAALFRPGERAGLRALLALLVAM